MSAPTVTEMTPSECWSHLSMVPVGRVGVSVDAMPLVLPVNFAVADRGVVFRTVEGSKFHAAVAGAVLAFEADAYEPSGRSGWSVVVRGRSSVVTDPADIERLASITIDPWAVDGAADRYVRIEAVLITGRRFER